MFDGSFLAAAATPTTVGLPTTSGLAFIDYVIVLTYLLGVVGIGAYFAKYVDSAEDLFLSGKTLPFWAVGMSIVASDIGAVDLVSGAGAAYKYGIAQANFDWIGSMPATAISALIFIPYFWRAGVYTIPEFLGKRYNAAVQLIEAILWLFFMATMLAVMLWVTAVMLKTGLGWSTTTSIWITAVIIGIYTVTGGLTAIVMTDVIQMTIMYIGSGALLILSFHKAGGIAGVVDGVQKLGAEYGKHFTLLIPHGDPTPYPWTGIVFGLGIVLSTAYFVGNQAVVQRALGARTEWDAKAGMLLAGLLKLMVPILGIIPGLAGVAIYPGLEKPDTAVPLMIRDLFPAGLKGLMFAGFFAALMSNIDSYVNSCTTMFMADVYAKVYRHVRGRSFSQRHGLWLGRFLTAGLLIGAGLLAPIIERFETIYVAMQTLFSFFQGPTLAILILGILWRRATGWGALGGLVVGVCTAISLTAMGSNVFPSNAPFLFISFWSFVLALLVTILVSLLTRPEPPDKIRGLVWGEVMHDPSVQAALRNRVNGGTS